MQYNYKSPDNINSQDDLINYISNNIDSNTNAQIINPYLGKEEVDWKIINNKIQLQTYIAIRGYFKILLIGELFYQKNITIRNEIILIIKYPFIYNVVYLFTCILALVINLNIAITQHDQYSLKLISEAIYLKSIHNFVIITVVIMMLSLLLLFSKKKNGIVLKESFEQLYDTMA